MDDFNYYESVQCTLCVRTIRAWSFKRNKGVCGMCAHDMKKDVVLREKWLNVRKANDWVSCCPSGEFSTRDYAENAKIHIRQAMRRLIFLSAQKRVIKKGFKSKGCNGRFRIWEVAGR